MFATVNGVELFYHVEGSGIPCVVPCGAGTPLYERTFSQELRAHIQFVFVELRGSGRSGGSAADVTLASLVDDLDQLRRTLGLGRVAVMAHSAPGCFAVEYAARYPQHTSHIMLVGTPPNARNRQEAQRYREAFATEERRAIWRRNRERVTDEILRSAPPEEVLRLQTVSGAPWFWYDPHFDASDLIAGSVVNGEFMSRFFGVLLKDYDLSARFPHVRCPAFVAHGRYDFVVPPYLWEDELGKLPDATFRLFERSGHYPHYEEQRLFDGQLLHWLGAHRAASEPAGDSH